MYFSSSLKLRRNTLLLYSGESSTASKCNISYRRNDVYILFHNIPKPYYVRYSRDNVCRVPYIITTYLSFVLYQGKLVKFMEHNSGMHHPENYKCNPWSLNQLKRNLITFGQQYHSTKAATKCGCIAKQLQIYSMPCRVKYQRTFLEIFARKV